MLTPAGFLNDLTRCVGHLGLHGLQDFGELAIAPPRTARMNSIGWPLGNFMADMPKSRPSERPH
jgi:hypothetical protein